MREKFNRWKGAGRRCMGFHQEAMQGLSYQANGANLSRLEPQVVGGAPILCKLKRIMSQRARFTQLQFPPVCLLVYQDCLTKVALVWQPCHPIGTKLSAFAGTVFPESLESMAKAMHTGRKARMHATEPLESMAKTMHTGRKARMHAIESAAKFKQLATKY